MGSGRTRAAVVRVNPLHDRTWDRKLEAWPEATIFHTAAWARVLHSSYGYNPVYLTLGDAQRLEAVLPVMDINSWLTGRRGVSLPFTDACEPLSEDRDQLRTLCGAAQECAAGYRWKRIEYRRVAGKAPAFTSSKRYFGHKLELIPDESALFARLSGGARGAVRNAVKKGVRHTVATDLGAMRKFYHLLCATRKRLGVPPQPFRFFESIQRHILAPGHGLIVLAWHEDRLVAGAVFFHFGRNAIYKYAASDAASRHLNANNLVLWEAIKHYAGKGVRTLDFGRTDWGDEGLRKFKLSWGTTEHEIEYADDHLRRSQPESTGEHSRSGWSRWIFKRLPLSIARGVGAVLYKHMAAVAVLLADWREFCLVI